MLRGCVFPPRIQLSLLGPGAAAHSAGLQPVFAESTSTYAPFLPPLFPLFYSVSFLPLSQEQKQEIELHNYWMSWIQFHPCFWFLLEFLEILGVVMWSVSWMLPLFDEFAQLWLTRKLPSSVCFVQSWRARFFEKSLKKGTFCFYLILGGACVYECQSMLLGTNTRFSNVLISESHHPFLQKQNKHKATKRGHFSVGSYWQSCQMKYRTLNVVTPQITHEYASSVSMHSIAQDIFTLKHCLLSLWNSDVTGVLHFYLLSLATLISAEGSCWEEAFLALIFAPGNVSDERPHSWWKLLPLPTLISTPLLEGSSTQPEEQWGEGRSHAFTAPPSARRCASWCYSVVWLGKRDHRWQPIFHPWGSSPVTEVEVVWFGNTFSCFF